MVSIRNNVDDKAPRTHLDAGRDTPTSSFTAFLIPLRAPYQGQWDARLVSQTLGASTVQEQADPYTPKSVLATNAASECKETRRTRGGETSQYGDVGKFIVNELHTHISTGLCFKRNTANTHLVSIRAS